MHVGVVSAFRKSYKSHIGVCTFKKSQWSCFKHYRVVHYRKWQNPFDIKEIIEPSNILFKLLVHWIEFGLFFNIIILLEFILKLLKKYFFLVERKDVLTITSLMCIVYSTCLNTCIFVSSCPHIPYPMSYFLSFVVSPYSCSYPCSVSMSMLHK